MPLKLFVTFDYKKITYNFTSYKMKFIILTLRQYLKDILIVSGYLREACVNVRRGITVHSSTKPIALRR